MHVSYSDPYIFQVYSTYADELKAPIPKPLPREIRTVDEMPGAHIADLEAMGLSNIPANSLTNQDSKIRVIT
jgi:hypothetical protein